MRLFLDALNMKELVSQLASGARRTGGTALFPKKYRMSWNLLLLLGE